jgi:chemotaxis protein CheZ
MGTMNGTQAGDLGTPTGRALGDLVRAEVEAAIRAGLSEQLTEMRRFVDRRFAEISAEIQAGATMAELTEAALAERIGQVSQEVARMTSQPTSEARTSGLDLESVVQTTEAAANQIMEAAETVMGWIDSGADATRSAEMSALMQSIFEACSFQDITSQRVRRAIHHLQEVDVMLSNIASPNGVHVPRPAAGPGGTGADLDQDLIDKLMNG